MRRILLAAAATGMVLAGSQAAQAEPVRLTASELDTVTAGNINASGRNLFAQALTGTVGSLFVAIDVADSGAFDLSVLDSPDPGIRNFSNRLFLFAARRGFFN